MGLALREPRAEELGAVFGRRDPLHLAFALLVLFERTVVRESDADQPSSTRAMWDLMNWVDRCFAAVIAHEKKRDIKFMLCWIDASLSSPAARWSSIHSMTAPRSMSARRLRSKCGRRCRRAWSLGLCSGTTRLGGGRSRPCQLIGIKPLRGGADGSRTRPRRCTKTRVTWPCSRLGRLPLVLIRLGPPFPDVIGRDVAMICHAIRADGSASRPVRAVHESGMLEMCLKPLARSDRPMFLRE